MSRHLMRAAGLLAAGSLAWLGVCSVELHDLQYLFRFQWIASVHLLRVAFWFSLAATLAVLALGVVRQLLHGRVRRPDVVTTLVLLAACAWPAWDTASALLSGGLFSESEQGRLLQLPVTLLLCCAYVLAWFHHVALCRVPGFEWPRRFAGVLSRVPAPLRAGALWACGVAVLVVAVDAIDHQMRAYLFVARYMLPAVWLLAASSLWAPALWLPPGGRWLLGALGTGVIAGAFVLQPHAASLRTVQSDLARLAGIASLSDVAAEKERGAKLAALDFSRPQRFDCVASGKLTAATPRAPSHRNVILLSVDALRKDAVTAQHEGEALMPALARFTQSGVSFDRAVTTYPATLFAVGSALTGLGPSEVLFAPDVPKNVFTLAQRSFDSQQIFLPESYWFRKPIIEKLFTQGTPMTFGKSGANIADHLIAALRGARNDGKRVMVWGHFYEPHVLTPKGKTAEGRRADYRSQTRYVDKQLSRVLHTMRDLKYFEDSLVIFFADHGEGLGELSFLGHHVYLNHFLADIPLVVHAPGLTARTDARTTTIADIAPTILHWLGLPTPHTDARSLLDAPTADEARFVVSEAFPLRGSALFELARKRITSIKALQKRIDTVRKSAVDYAPKVAITTATHRLIVNRDTGAEELYDRVKDPTERHNLAGGGLPVHERLRRELAAWAVRQSESIYCAVKRAN